ncbi:Tryptophanyl-tRNA synthetase [Spironucleus salmonicida]|nr:Tryptophanyl-tRNA synthetase [Spironucleus salmonicida]|eukprot:EST46477.1 Tryptophanyl-tRNA synthetase [Spironucleus salmonicida]
MIPFYFCRYLQQAFGCPLVIQITDDEKLLRDPTLSFEQIHEFALSNIRDILACKFDQERTFIYLNTAYIGSVYKFSCVFERAITLSQLRGAFGFSDVQNVGYVSFPAKQMQPAFSQAFPHIFTEAYCKAWRAARTDVAIAPLAQKEGETKKQFEQRRLSQQGQTPIELTPFCLIPCGYEQEPYWRVARDIAPRLGLQKPATIYNSFIPALQGVNSKMSASDPQSAVYMDDSAAQIKKKINKFAFSGGRATVEEQREFGANLAIDVSVQYLEVFMDDQARLDSIKARYQKGEMLTGEVKAELIALVQGIVGEHQRVKEQISDDMVRAQVYGWGRRLWGEK